MKAFNTTGVCVPEKHYMVDITERVAQIRAMVDDGKYFCIKQSVTVEPSTRYVYKLSYKGTNVDSNAASIKINGGSKFDIASVSANWQEISWKTFTTGEDTTSISFEVYVTDKSEELYFDNIILRKYSGGDNLLSNGDFEATYSQNEIGRIQSVLERAKRSNVAVSFLLQPLYFWRVSGCEDMYSSATGTSYNINDERARDKIEQYLRAIIPVIAQCDAVRDICITNEPSFDTRTYPDFYEPKFREYLLQIYGTLNNINSKYGTSYANINSITMPAEYSKSALFYDWVIFNENNLAEWNAWMAQIIKEYTNKPLHCKMETILCLPNTATEDIYCGVRMLNNLPSFAIMPAMMRQIRSSGSLQW